MDDDYELLGLATGIFDIRRAVGDDGRHLLEWQAFGVIRDGGFDDPFRWCYRFTVLAWDGDSYAAQIDQRDVHAFFGDARGRDVPFGWETALSFHPSFVEVYSSGGSGNAEHFRHRVSVLGLRKQQQPAPTASLSILPEMLRFPYPDHLGRPATTRNAFLSNLGSRRRHAPTSPSSARTPACSSS